MKQVPSIGVKLRKTIKADYIKVAKYLTEDSGEVYAPYEVQAITWVAHKRVYGV